MRILALAIFAIGMISIGPAVAQTYDPTRFACTCTAGGPTITNASTRRCVQRVGIGPLGTVRHQSIFAGTEGPVRYRRHRRAY